MTSQLWWDVARAGGLLGWGLLSASVLWGLALSSRIFGRRPRPAWLLDLHKFLGTLSVVFVAVHLLALWADTYVYFGPRELVVPMYIPVVSTVSPSSSRRYSTSRASVNG